MNNPYYNPNALSNEVIKYWSKEEIAKREAQKKIRVPQKVTKKKTTKKTATKKPAKRNVPIVLDKSKSLADVAQVAQKQDSKGWLWGLGALGALLWFI